MNSLCWMVLAPHKWLKSYNDILFNVMEVATLGMVAPAGRPIESSAQTCIHYNPQSFRETTASRGSPQRTRCFRTALTS